MSDILDNHLFPSLINTKLIYTHTFLVNFIANFSCFTTAMNHGNHFFCIYLLSVIIDDMFCYFSYVVFFAHHLFLSFQINLIPHPYFRLFYYLLFLPMIFLCYVQSIMFCKLYLFMIILIKTIFCVMVVSKPILCSIYIFFCIGKPNIFL